MKITRIIDVSRQIHPDMTVWPNDNKIKISQEESIEAGYHCNLTSIAFGLHTGTHVDSPYHFIAGGIKIDELDLSKFLGFVKVFEIDTEKYVTKDHISELPIEKGDIVFFKTNNSAIDESEPFREDFIALDETAAWFLANRGIKTVGMDYLSVEAFHNKNHEVHMILLSHEVGIIEGLNLRDAKEGTYLLSALPLRVHGVEGSPVRAVLAEFED